MRKRRLTAALMAGIMVCGMLTACQSKTVQDQQGGEEETAQTSDAGETSGSNSGAPEGKQVLSVTTWDNESSPQFQAVIDAYEEENPDVEIKVIDTSADEYNNSLGISLSAAQPDPDVIWVKDMGSMLQMADKEQLLPIDDFIEEDNLDLSIYKGAAEQLMYNGKILFSSLQKRLVCTLLQQRSL